jgi:hypothetical protein
MNKEPSVSQTANAYQIQQIREPSATDTLARRHLMLLGLALALGAIAVCVLRQPWAKEQLLPWLLLLIAMFAGANALQGLQLWLPGQPIFPQLAVFPKLRIRLFGVIYIIAALVLTTTVVLRLWPDYTKWDGTPLLWITSLGLILIGAWSVSAVGQASPRAAAGLRMWQNSRRSRWLEIGAFVFILILAIFLRTYRLSNIPPGIYVDETNGATDALHLLEGNGVSPFATGWYETPNGYIYYMAAIFKLLGSNWIGLKVVSLIPAILTIPAVYFLARLLFGPLAGLCAMLFMAVSRWHLSMSRWGWNETAPPLFQVLSFFFLIRGLRDRRALDYALSGLLAGLSVYTYLSARLAILTLILYVIYWLWSDPAGWKASLRRSWIGLSILAVAAGVAVAPIMVTYLTNPFVLTNRVSQISVFREIQDQGSITPLVDNIGDILKFFHQTGDLQGKHNLPGEPMADPITGLLFAVGVAYAILAWRDQRRVLLLLWLVIGLSGSFLSSHSESPQSYRALTAVPAVVILAADVLEQVTRGLYIFLREHPFAGIHPTLPVRASGALVFMALAGAAFWESGVYFGPQASSSAVVSGFNPIENDVAHETIAALQAGETVYLSPTFSDFSPLRFLLYGVFKSEKGINTLDNPPFHTILPEVNLPVPDDGHDVLILLDYNYWPLRDHISSFYPQAQMDLVQLRPEEPLYMRVKLPHEQVAALQGLNELLTYIDGRQEQRVVSQVELSASDPALKEVVWEGAIRLEHGGDYVLHGEGGLQVFLDGQLIDGMHYLGRGIYRLRVVGEGQVGDNARLIWQIPDGGIVPVPPQALFRVTGPLQGLLGTYWRNMNWEGDPLFHQITPFLMLAWPDEQPVVPNGEFSARFTGNLRVVEPGSYLLRIEADDGARLTLDGSVLGEGLTAGQPNDFNATIDLAAGDHLIQIDYFQQGGGTALRFFWSHAGEPLTPVPPASLIPAQP